MSEIVRYSNTKLTCYCQIKLDSGERILVSIATTPTPCVKIRKLIWNGMSPILFPFDFAQDKLRGEFAHSRAGYG